MIPNPWLVRGSVILGVAAVILLTVTTVNAGASPSLYNKAGREGVLMPEVIAQKQPPQKTQPVIKDNPQEIFTRKVNFRIPDEEVDRLSFVSMTEGVTLRILDVNPITETTRDERGKSIMLLLDNSYSMVQPSPPSPWNADWLPAADKDYKRIEAVKALLDVLSGEDRVALATFPRLNPMPGYRIPRVEPPAILQNFGPPDAILPELDKLKSNENSGTPLYRVIGEAVDWMSGEGEDRPKIAVLLTDGRDTESNSGTPDGLAEKVEASGITLITIALGPAPDLESLGKLSTEVISVSESDQLVPTFRRLAEKLKTMTIGWDVNIEFKRQGKPFGDDNEQVKVGYRSGKSPKRTDVRIGGVLPIAPTESKTPATKSGDQTQPKTIQPQAKPVEKV